MAAVRRECNPKKRFRNDPAFIDGFVLRYISEYTEALSIVNSNEKRSMQIPPLNNSTPTRAANSEQANVLPDMVETNTTCKPRAHSAFNGAVPANFVLPGYSQQKSIYSYKDEENNCSDNSRESIDPLCVSLRTRTFSETFHESLLQDGAVNGPYVYSWVIGNETGNFYSQCRAMVGKVEDCTLQESQIFVLHYIRGEADQEFGNVKEFFESRLRISDYDLFCDRYYEYLHAWRIKCVQSFTEMACLCKDHDMITRVLNYYTSTISEIQRATLFIRENKFDMEGNIGRFAFQFFSDCMDKLLSVHPYALLLDEKCDIF